MPTAHRSLAALARSNQAPVARPSQHMTRDEDVDDTLARDSVAPPQTARLLDGEREPRHLSVFAQHTVDQARSIESSFAAILHLTSRAATPSSSGSSNERAFRLQSP
jgi:hypothetical protein